MHRLHLNRAAANLDNPLLISYRRCYECINSARTPNPLGKNQSQSNLSKRKPVGISGCMDRTCGSTCHCRVDDLFGTRILLGRSADDPLAVLLTGILHNHSTQRQQALTSHFGGFALRSGGAAKARGARREDSKKGEECPLSPPNKEIACYSAEADKRQSTHRSQKAWMGSQYLGGNRTMETSYFILIVAFVVCLFVRTAYELLKEAGKVNPENKLIFAFIFTAMCALWVCWFDLCLLDPFQLNVPGAVRWGGLTLFVVGLVIAVGALFQLRGLENIDHLVTTGLFSRLRHPMYTGFVLWIVGWSSYHGAFASLAVGMIGIANILFWRRLEESRLRRQYGTVYEQYRTSTWF